MTTSDELADLLDRHLAAADALRAGGPVNVPGWQVAGIVAAPSSGSTWSGRRVTRGRSGTALTSPERPCHCPRRP